MTTARTPSRAGLHPELTEHIRQLEAIRRQGRRLLEGLEEEPARWRPARERWSIAECVEHLDRVGARVLPRIDRALRRGRRQRLLAPLDQGEFRHGFVGDRMVRAMEPPPRMHLKAPRLYTPGSSRLRRLAPGTVFERFFTLQDEIEERLLAAQGLDLARIKLASPVTRLVKLSLGQWFAFLLAHERRHLWQAEQVRSAEGFPGESAA